MKHVPKSLPKVFAFFILFQPDASSQWSWVQPYPQGNTLISSAVAGETAYFLGESSMILMTADGGHSWQTISPYSFPKDIATYSDIANQLITFGDSSHGWISRGTGGLFFTTNAGRSWQRKQTFFEHPGAVYFSGPQHGFTTGDEYRTSNGGQTWTCMTLTGPNDGYFGAFTSTDSMHVWAVSQGTFGGGGKIKYTTNGGVSWAYQNSGLQSNSDTTYSLIAIRMNRSGIGIATGYARPSSTYRGYGLILRTTDFGNTWTRTDDLPQYNTILNVSDSIWVLVGNDWWGYNGVAYQAMISRSTDAGLSWQRVYQPSSSHPAPRTAVWIPSHQVMIAAGFYGAMYRSTDLGATWEPLWVSAPSLHDIAFSYMEGANTSFGFAVGDYATLMRSTDRGQTWVRSTINVGYPYYLLAVKAKGQTVWAGGSQRTLVRSTDSGNSWSRIPTPLDGPNLSGYVINDIDVYDSLHAVATTTLPNYYNIVTHLIYTSDGGNNWTLYETPRGIMINRVALPRTRQILIGGANWSIFTNQTGFIWSSTDAGQTWDSTALPSAVTDLVMFNCQEGLALTYEKLYRTSNGGRNWYPANFSWTTGPPTWWSLGGLTVPSEKSNSVLAYLSGGAGYYGEGFIISTNKGVTWTQTQIELPNQEPMTGIASADGLTNIFVVTERGGFIVKTNQTPVVYQPPDLCRALPLGSFSVSTDSLQVGGGLVTLSWISYDADSAWIDQGIGPVALIGSLQIPVNHTTTFTITLKNEWGTIRYSRRVFVQPPATFSLAQNYPNPFNASTTITFSLPIKTTVSLKLFNVLGEEVATLAQGEYQEGLYRLVWDASQYATGVYFYRLIAGSFSDTKKLLFVR